MTAIIVAGGTGTSASRQLENFRLIVWNVGGRSVKPGPLYPLVTRLPNHSRNS